MLLQLKTTTHIIILLQLSKSKLFGPVEAREHPLGVLHVQLGENVDADARRGRRSQGHQGNLYQLTK